MSQQISDAAPLIEVHDLKKTYGTTPAVRGISFKVARGEVVGFLGPNGAGKSTTMKMLTGYLRPTAGRASIAGIDVADEPLRARQVLGYLPENAPLYNDMMVIDFLRFIADVRAVTMPLRDERLKEICRRCGLTQVLGKDIGQLSKGFRQRVGLAQALVHDPDLLILDEPTSGLDPNQIVEIRELIRDLGREKTVLLSSHILPEVQATCSRILIVNNGSLVADDSTTHLSDTAGVSGALIRLVLKNRLRAGLDRAKLHGLLAAIPGVHGVDSHEGEGHETLGFMLRSAGNIDPREHIFQAAISHEFVILDLHRERTSLEDTFRRLTRADEMEGPHA